MGERNEQHPSPPEALRRTDRWGWVGVAVSERGSHDVTELWRHGYDITGL